MRGRKQLMGLVSLLAIWAGPWTADAQEDPKDVIAAQIRDQGYECRSPKSATRDPQVSRPGELAWVLQCENNAYRVRLIPHMAAKVERIEPKP
jgi:hypothetical protein